MCYTTDTHCTLTDLVGQFPVAERHAPGGGEVAEPPQAVQQRAVVRIGHAAEQQVLVLLLPLQTRAYRHVQIT